MDSKATNPFLSTHRYKKSYSISKRGKVTIFVKFLCFSVCIVYNFLLLQFKWSTEIWVSMEGFCKQDSELTFVSCYVNKAYAMVWFTFDQLIRQIFFSSWFFFPPIRFKQKETVLSVFHIHNVYVLGFQLQNVSKTMTWDLFTLHRVMNFLSRL